MDDLRKAIVEATSGSFFNYTPCYIVEPSDSDGSVVVEVEDERYAGTYLLPTSSLSLSYPPLNPDAPEAPEEEDEPQSDS